MGVLVITVIAAILCCMYVISIKTFGIILALSVAWSIIGAVLYFTLGWLKFFYHDVLGWHTPDDSPMRSDGLSTHAICKHCGKDIIQDSQGNWF